MLKKILLIAVIVATCNQFSFAMQEYNPDEKITMPSEKTLRGIFSKWGLGYFVEKTRIIQWLGAGEEAYTMGLEVVKETMLYDYEEYMKKSYPEGSKMLSIAMTLASMNLNKAIDAIVKEAKEAEKKDGESKKITDKNS